MPRRCFSIIVDFDTHALMRVLEPFAALGLRPQWLLLCEENGAFSITAHYDDLDEDIAVTLLARLQEMPEVRIAGVALLGAGASSETQSTKPH